MSTKIQWTDETWNPIIGCSKVSPGCENCYAETMAKRLSRINSTGYYNNVLGHDYTQTDSKGEFDPKPTFWNNTTFYVSSQMHKPLRLKKPRKIFVCSMGDLFHERTSFDEIDEVFAVMAICEQHTFQVLTKRPERMKQYFDERRDWRVGQLMIMFSGTNYDLPCWPLNNVWLGVTAENQEQANKRIPVLLEIPSVVKFVSVEPMLGAIDLTNIDEGIGLKMDLLNGFGYSLGEKYTGGTKLDWVICGGESGKNARPINPDWVRNLRNQCEANQVPFFFKSWGKYVQVLENRTSIGVLDAKRYKTPDTIDDIEYKQFPKVKEE